MFAEAHPTELKTLLRAESCIELERSLYCECYDDCLTEVVRRGWTSWSCTLCPRRAEPPRRALRAG
jgi:hypothetical protein